MADKVGLSSKGRIALVALEAVEDGGHGRERAATGESHSDVTQGAGIFNIHWITKLPPFVRFKDKILTKLSNFIV